MIKIENTEVYGFEAAIRGMRNPMNSWDKSDSYFGFYYDHPDDCEPIHKNVIGPNDLKLMKNLSKAGTDHSKFLRMINVTCDITAPLFWWKEFDTYKVGTVRNSCSTMHKIHVKEFSVDDFSHEGVDEVSKQYPIVSSFFKGHIDTLEWLRRKFNETQDKKFWRALIEMLPDGFNMRATVQLNYQVVKAQRAGRKNHKVIEWHTYCDWIDTLPYFKEICIEV